METSPKATLYPDAQIRNPMEQGLAFQDFVCIQLSKHHIILQNISSTKFQFEVGENLQGFEIKLDNRCTDTKQLSIETQEKSSRDMMFYTNSGILRNDNSFMYIQGNYDAFWMFSKKWLVRWLKEKKPEIKEYNGTLKSFYLPIDIADWGAVWKWNKQSEPSVDTK